MNWQIKYAIKNLSEDGRHGEVEHISGDFIKIYPPNQPEVLAAITNEYAVNKDIATSYHTQMPGLQFLCGYRKECIWEGGAIEYLQDNIIGWGNFGALSTGILEGNATIATHKVYAFADRLLRQYHPIAHLDREFDRVYKVTLKNGKRFRMAMIADYEPTADGVRTIWENFGPVDLMWNINPNGKPTSSAIEAGAELGCEVNKWEDVKQFIKKI